MSWNIEQCKMWSDWAQEACKVTDEEYLELWKIAKIQAKRSGNVQAYETAKAKVVEYESKIAANELEKSITVFKEFADNHNRKFEK